jgi:Cyclophilin type peptidyl-prolyl cis-trans isomerase/CLD
LLFFFEIDRFGPGPHHVKFTVLLPTDETETERSFIVEMASLDVMPHAVHLFLEQVAHGLWDNGWFYLNGPHVLQAGPQVEEEEEELYHSKEQTGVGSNGDAEMAAAADERSLALKPFIDLELDTLAFPEYSDKHPHNKWTLGFTGRPGGPDFYINKMNNTEAHGPGGQHQHDLEEYADACFATVVEGFDVLELIFKEPTYPDDHDWGWFYEEPVHIVGARVMEKVLAPVVVDTKISSSSSNNTDESPGRRKPIKPLAKHKIEHQVIP